MPYKISGRVPKHQEAFYCSTDVPIKVRRISFNGKQGRVVKQSKKEIAVGRRKCIHFNEAGKSYSLTCSTCKGGCFDQVRCPVSQDEVQPVFIL
jgi:hypothetical protein